MASQTQLVPPMAPAQTVPMRDLDDSFDMQATLLLAAIESFTVGLVIVAQDGTILHQNRQAHTLLKKMPGSSSTAAIPDNLWYTCHSLMANQDKQCDLCPDGYNIVLEDDIPIDHSTIHVRVQWFDWDNSTYQSSDCFLITLEDRQHSLTVVANQEAQRYGLTTRETDVWCLKRMGHSYREIANALYISENTVKKHVKNIYSKKEQSAESI